MATDLAAEQITDLLRSAWLIERSRSAVYALWVASDPSFDASSGRAAERAHLISTALEGIGRLPDEELVDAHTAWQVSTVGEEPGAVALSRFFLARLGDWVDAHAGPFLGEVSSRMRELHEEDKAELRFPESLPDPPPFVPLQTPRVEPPGGVRFRFAILGDLHIGSRHAEKLVRAAIADINRSGADLTIQVGDIADHGEESEFAAAAAILASLEMPWETMTGNHDMYAMSEGRLAGREYFERHFARRPDGALIEHGGVRFALLDSADSAASPFPPFDIVTGTFLDGPAGAVVRGALTDPEHDLLARIARPGGGPAFVFLHHPPQPYTGFPPILFGLNENDSGRLHAVCDSGNVWGVFAGHTHRNARTTNYSGVPAQEIAIPRDFPHGFALVDVGDSGYTYRFVQISDQELLRSNYGRSSEIQRRYAGGSGEELAFSWTA